MVRRGTATPKTHCILTYIVGGRSAGYERSLRQARATAIGEMVAEEAEQLGADAVIGVDVDYESIQGQGGSMLLVRASGTAVKL